MRRIISSFVLGSLLAFSASAQQKGSSTYPPEIAGATVHVYRTVGDVELKLWRFAPDAEGGNRPAIIFFFGGGWRSGSPTQFVPQAKHLAERGMVAFVADYRVASRHGTKAKDCVEDAREALRWVRANAATLGIDPTRIAAGGGSAGGHIAACLGTIDEDPESKADAMVLFNPACVIAPYQGRSPWPENRSEEMTDRMGIDPVELSPIHHVDESDPPAVVFHGLADTTVPPETAVWFTEALKDAGVRSYFHGFADAPHGFFNHTRRDQFETDFYGDSVAKMDAFLVSLGWLSAPSP